MLMKANGTHIVMSLFFACIVALPLSGDITYKDLNLYARVHRSDVTSIGYDITRALQEENVALSGLFPIMGINATKQKQRGNVWPNQQITLSLAQSIYEPAGPMAQWWLAQTETALLRWSKDNLLDDTRYEVGQTFLSYRNILHKKSTNDALDRSSSELFKKALANYNQGMISAVELEQEKALFENSQSKVKSYINEISTNKENLAFASERVIDAPIVEFDSNTLYTHILEGLSPYTPDDFVIDALACRKELRVIDQQIEVANLNKDIARYSYIPTIRFVADISRLSAPSLLAYETTHPYRFGLSFDWTFDLGNFFKFHSAESDRLKSVFDRKRAEFTIENEIRTTCDQLEIIAKDIVAVRAKVEEVRLAFARNTEAYKVGMLSEVEFKKAETEWEQAQFNLETSITQAAQKHEELLWSAGYPKRQVSCFDLIEKSV